LRVQATVRQKIFHLIDMRNWTKWRTKTTTTTTQVIPWSLAVGRRQK